MRTSVCRGLVLSALLLSSAARAETPHFNAERLSFDPSGQGSLLVGGGLTLPGGAFRLAFAGQYEHAPLVLQANDGSELGYIQNRVTGHLLATLGVTDRLELGLQVPLVLYQNGADLSAYGFGPVAATGVANPLLSGRYAFLSRANGAPVNLAVGLGLGIPVGSESALGGGGAKGFSATPDVQASRDFGPLLASLQLGFQLRATTKVDSRDLGSELNVQGAVGLHKNEWKPEVILRTAVPLNGGMPANFEAMLAARHTLGAPTVEGFALAGLGVGTLPGTPDFRAILGVSWRPDLAPKEALPVVAAAPTPPAPVCPPPPPAPMCPAAKCPSSAPAASTDPCAPGNAHTPSQCPALDDDGDGIQNRSDECPREAGPAITRGCAAPDRDKDAVADVEDSCPDEAGPSENLGCPVKDADKDGVADTIDNCPNEAGIAGNHGCPAAIPQEVVITRERVVRLRSRLLLKAPVNFELGKADISPSSFAELNQLAAVLVAHPELTRLAVEGHTDNAGSDQTNQKLSQARADAVRLYLEKHGVKKGRVTSIGYGSGKPIASNDTDAGRARNRRVEVVSTDEEVVSP